MTNMHRKIDGAGLLALAQQLSEVEDTLADDHKVTADDKQAIVKQIEVLRKKIRRGADDLEYDNTQLLADRLREVNHILSDLISAKAIKGGDTRLLQKLSNQIVNVTKSLSFGGDDDDNNDGFKDSADLGFIEDTKDDSDSTQQFHNAVKKAITDKPEQKPEPKSDNVAKPKVEDKPDAKVEDKKADKSDKSKKTDDAEDSEETDDNDDGKKKLDKKKPAKSEKKKSGGFMDSLDAEASAEVTAGLRFSYFGIRSLKKGGEKVRVLKAMYGNNEEPNVTVYYYQPTKTLFGGDIDRTHSAFEKTLKEKNGYHALAQFIPKLIRSGKLVQLKKKVVDATAEIAKEDPDSFWSYIGVQEHPTKSGKKAIWFEIGDKQFAAIPSKRFEGGDVNEASNWIKINILGNKDSVGKSYIHGLKAMNDLVHGGKLKIIFHSAV